MILSVFLTQLRKIRNATCRQGALHFIRGVGWFGHAVASLQGAVEQLIHGQIRVGGSSCRKHFK